MAKEVVWQPDAKEDFREIVSYLLDTWPSDVAEKFTEQIDKVQELIQNHPNIGMKVGRLRSIRKIAVPPYYSLYYTFLNNEIWILNILDNRQNPEKV
jgi:addiction module RelE/StbE family toxin